MQKRVRRVLPLFLLLTTLLLIGLLLFTGCEGGSTGEDTGDNGTVVANPETDPVTDAFDTESVEETAAPSDETEGADTEPTLWTPDMGKFNEGKVEYVKEVETIVLDAFPDDQLGAPVAVGDKGVHSVFVTDFSGDDATFGGDALARNEGATVLVDGVFYMPYDETSDDLIAKDGWTTWSPVSGASVKSFKQVQLSADWQIIARGEGAWMTAMWGCYVSNYAGKIPDTPGDGLWISFNPAANKITVYHPDQAKWPAGLIDVPVEEGILNGQIQTDIVCMPDYTTYVYITPEAEDTRRLVCTVKFEDGKIKIYNEAAEMLIESDCGTGSLSGENFVLFTHAGGGVKMDNLAILACSKGEVIENVEVTATPTEGNALGLDITDKTGLVSICYSVWFDAILGGGSEPVTNWHNITEILAGKQEWGGIHAFHYWAKPAQGYYRSSDKVAIRNNMTMLYEAGVDFVVIDLTNAGDGYIGSSAWTSYIQTPMDAMCDTIMEMRAEGKGTPYVVFWCGNSDGPLYQELYDKYHAVEKWRDCFVYWDGKPLFITTHVEPEDFPLKDQFTVRAMWGLNDNHTTNHWSFLNVNNYGTVSSDANGNPEQVSVAVASQETYMSSPTAHGRNGGIFWYTQWAYAFEVRPKIVGLTWWNEWTAQRFETADSPYSFVDNYNAEYSRDIEPMEGGHGDQYYQWLKQYIAHYKAGLDCPVLVEEGLEGRAENALRKAKREAYQP